jgi:hypothetical protein
MGALFFARLTKLIVTFTLDDCIVLDVDRLFRDRYLVDGARRDGRIDLPGGYWIPYSWDGYNRVLKITITEPQKPQTIRVVRQVAGCAWRYFFDVPPRRVRKLFYMPGDAAFRTRNALGLKYRSRSVGAKKRRDAMAKKIRSRLGVTGTHVRPSGMRRSEWMWLLIRLAELENATG